MHLMSAGICALSLLSACGPTAPACRVTTPDGTDQRYGNAGCLIESQGTTLLIVHRYGGKLGFPGGTALEGEVAQCTAHRETWEETGLNVAVGPLLMQFENGFLLYACEAKGDLDVANPPPLPLWSRTETRELVFSDLSRVEASDWRFPEQLGEVSDLLRERAVSRGP